jgi:tetratricopeptide (TPR) repeat protein
MLTIDPNAPELHLNLGNAFLAQGDQDRAIACYSTSVRLAPDCAYGYANLGHAFLMDGRFTAAMSCLRHALKLDPDLLEAHFTAGRAFASQGMFDRADEHLSKVMNSKRPPAYMVREIRSIRQVHQGEALDQANEDTPGTSGCDSLFRDYTGDKRNMLTEDDGMDDSTDNR